jgi:hypothetical protein
MRKSIVLFLSILSPLFLLAQQLPKERTFSHDQYLRISKSQRNTGLILLGGGVAVGTVGFFLFRDNFQLFGGDGNNSTADTGGFMLLAGTASVLTSGGFFIASAVNKGKANSMSLSIKMERGMPYVVHHMANTYFPAVSISLPIR